MRAIVLLAGLALSAAAPLAVQAACPKPGTLAAAAAQQLGKCRETPPAQPAPPTRAAHRSSHYAQATPDARATCRLEARPAFDAGGQAVYQPTRACGRS